MVEQTQANWVKLSRVGKLKKVVGKTGVTTKQVEIAIADPEDESEAIVGELQVDLTPSTLRKWSMPH